MYFNWSSVVCMRGMIPVLYAYIEVLGTFLESLLNEHKLQSAKAVQWSVSTYSAASLKSIINPTQSKKITTGFPSGFNSVVITGDNIWNCGAQSIRRSKRRRSNSYWPDASMQAGGFFSIVVVSPFRRKDKRLPSRMSPLNIFPTKAWLPASRRPCISRKTTLIVSSVLTTTVSLCVQYKSSFCWFVHLFFTILVFSKLEMWVLLASKYPAE